MVQQGTWDNGDFVSWAAYRSKMEALGHFQARGPCGICNGMFGFNERCIGCKLAAVYAAPFVLNVRKRKGEVAH